MFSRPDLTLLPARIAASITIAATAWVCSIAAVAATGPVTAASSGSTPGAPATIHGAAVRKQSPHKGLSSYQHDLLAIHLAERPPALWPIRQRSLRDAG